MHKKRVIVKLLVAFLRGAVRLSLHAQAQAATLNRCACLAPERRCPTGTEIWAPLTSVHVGHPERKRALIVANEAPSGCLRSTTWRMSRSQRRRRLFRMFRRHRLITLRRSRCQRALCVVVSSESELCIGDGGAGSR